MKPKARPPGDNSSLSVGKKAKAEKIPQKGKTPRIPFHIFMDSFKKDYKEKHPNDKANKVKKAGCAKWRAMTVGERAPFVAKADKFKAECSLVVASNDSQEQAPFVAEADKSKAECSLVVASNVPQAEVGLVAAGYPEKTISLVYQDRRLRTPSPPLYYLTGSIVSPYVDF